MKRFLFCCFASLLLAGCGGSTTQPSQTAGSKGPSANELLAKMAAKYRSASTYVDNAQYVEQSVRREQGVERELPYFQLSIAYERPNKLRLRREEAIMASAGRVSYDIASDGSIVRCVAGELPEQVHESAAPEKLTLDNFIPTDEFRSAILEVSIENIFPQLVMLLSPDDSSTIFPETEAPKRLKDKEIDGALYHRVSFSSTAGTRVLWIDPQTYALRRMEIPTESQRRQLDPKGRYSHLSFWIDYQEVAFDAEIDSATFVMDIPEGARRVSQLVQPPSVNIPEQAGKPVGKFSFTSIDGETVTPETIAGKVAVLDFWFTGCPPCKTQTPVLEEVYQRFVSSKKVVFYAVSSDRAALPNDQVVKTLQQWGSTMPVLRDTESSAYQYLGVRKTPTTMVIGADGRVQLFQVGVHQNSEPLIKFIEQVLDGKDFAAEAMAQFQERLKKFNDELDSVTITDEN